MRGQIRLIAGNSFALSRPYHGLVPLWGGLQDAAAKKSVNSLLAGDDAKSDQLFRTTHRGTYWIGKALGAVAQLMCVAEAQGQTETRDALLATLKERLESVVRRQACRVTSCRTPASEPSSGIRRSTQASQP